MTLAHSEALGSEKNASSHAIPDSPEETTLSPTLSPGPAKPNPH